MKKARNVAIGLSVFALLCFASWYVAEAWSQSRWSTHGQMRSLLEARMDAARITTRELESGQSLPVDGGREVCVAGQCARVGEQECVGEEGGGCRERSPILERAEWESFDYESLGASQRCTVLNSTIEARRSLAASCAVPFQNVFVMLTVYGYPGRSELRCLSGLTSISKRGVLPGPEFIVAVELNRDGGADLRYAINPSYADAGLVLPTCLP